MQRALILQRPHLRAQAPSSVICLFTEKQQAGCPKLSFLQCPVQGVLQLRGCPHNACPTGVFLALSASAVLQCVQVDPHLQLAIYHFLIPMSLTSIIKQTRGQVS